MTTSPVGIQIPKLLPITGTFVPAFAAYFAFLSARVTQARINADTYIGDKSSNSSGTENDDVQVTVRSHENFAENVPLALFLASVVELNGGDRRVLTGGLATLLIARIIHVELGLRAPKSTGNGRPVGHLTSLGTILGLAGYAAYLVKGYWGF